MKTNSMKKIENRKSKIENSPAFTLIELLVVIAIMAILAAFTFPVLKKVKEGQYRSVARGELEQIATALERYKAAYGAYPPSNQTNSLVNPLYFELSGTTNDNINYTTLDGTAQINVGSVSHFGVGGFVNCNSKNKASAEDSQSAKNFLPGLKANRIGTNSIGDTLLLTSVRGPDVSYQPIGAPDVNPFRYNSANPTNNPNSYDLWVDLCIGGKTNRISNWSKQYQIIQ
jgi:prepilin-type N-terminal cleavage/methylation domain-containing protein